MFDVIKEALRAADEGTVKYMVEEQQKEIAEQRKTIAEQSEQIAERDEQIAEQAEQLAREREENKSKVIITLVGNNGSLRYKN